jgi:pimeloyl-ACP methyl ester carboxylesterase
VARFRAGQEARVARIDALARDLLADRDRAAERARGSDFDELPFFAQQEVLKRRAFEPVMVVYRTMANLHYVDRHLDPSGREYGSLLSERPDLMNMKLLGFARTVTPEAWLSTWSSISSNAELCRWLPSIEAPTLCVFAGRDREIYPRTDVEPITRAVAATDRTFITFDHARHYFEGDPGEDGSPDRELLMDTLVEWIRDRF